MENSISEERIIEAYRAAIQYGPEQFNNERRAAYVMTSEMVDFLLAMQRSDVFTDKAYHTAGRLGVDICCVDWMQDVAEENGDLQEFIDSLIDGYGEGLEVWYIYETSAGEEKAGPYPNKKDAVRDAGMLQFENGEKHHVVKRYKGEE